MHQIILLIKLWAFQYIEYFGWFTWLWPRVLCASPDQHPTSHVSQRQGALSLSQGPAPLLSPWCDKAQTHSSHQWSGCQPCRPLWHTCVCPSGSGSWAPGLRKERVDNCEKLPTTQLSLGDVFCFLLMSKQNILPKGNSGRSMNPWQLQSGVWYARGCTM